MILFHLPFRHLSHSCRIAKIVLMFQCNRVRRIERVQMTLTSNDDVKKRSHWCCTVMKKCKWIKFISCLTHHSSPSSSSFSDWWINWMDLIRIVMLMELINGLKIQNQFIEEPKDREEFVGSTVLLHCRTKLIDQNQVNWCKNDFCTLGKTRDLPFYPRYEIIGNILKGLFFFFFVFFICLIKVNIIFK